MTEPAPAHSAPLPHTALHAYVCNVCGSDHVTRKAWAAWDVAAQAWVLEVAFDYAHCHRCMGDARLDRVTLTSPPPAAITGPAHVAPG
jgi:hypothetical protein